VPKEIEDSAIDEVYAEIGDDAEFGKIEQDLIEVVIDGQ